MEIIALFCYNGRKGFFRRLVMQNVLNQVLTATEAAQMWNLAPITVRQACTGYAKAPARFNSTEARKSGKTWLISVDGMERVFGNRKMSD